MKQRYDVVLYDDHVMIDGRRLDGAVFTAPSCRIWPNYLNLYQFMADSAIEFQCSQAVLSDVIKYVLSHKKDPAKVLYIDSPTSSGSFKDFLAKIDDIECVYDKDNFIGIFMQKRIFD